MGVYLNQFLPFMMIVGGRQGRIRAYFWREINCHMVLFSFLYLASKRASLLTLRVRLWRGVAHVRAERRPSCSRSWTWLHACCVRSRWSLLSWTPHTWCSTRAPRGRSSSCRCGMQASASAAMRVWRRYALVQTAGGRRSAIPSAPSRCSRASWRSASRKRFPSVRALPA